MKKKIAWVSQHYYINQYNQLESEPEEETKPYIDEYEGPNNSMLDVNDMPVLMNTPFGMFRSDDSMNPYRQFKLWMAHTNFPITQREVNIIENVPGVEILYVLTKYRFFVGIGELFDIRDVRTNIENLICGIVEIKNEQIKNSIEELKTDLKNYDRWAIYLFPNGNIDYTHSEETDFEQKINLYRTSSKLTGGILFESDKQ